MAVKYSEELVLKVKLLKEKGLTRQQIADNLSLKESQIKSIIAIYKISPGKPTGIDAFKQKEINLRLIPKIKELLDENKTKSEICLILDISNQKLTRFIYQYKLARLKPLSKEEKSKIVELHERGLSRQRIGREINRSPHVITKFLAKNNIKTINFTCRKYFPNDTFFDTIDTESKAYFLGLLWADGHNDIKNNCIHIRLQEGDKHILETFGKAVYGDKIFPLYYEIRKDYSGNNYNLQNCYRLDINSKHMCETLLSYGATQTKSFTLEFPTCVPNHLIHHFIRGFFDGDGSISIHKKGGKTYRAFCFSIICSMPFGKRLNEVVKEQIGVELQYLHDYRYNIPMVYSKTSGSYKPCKVLNWFYKDATIFLQRKYETYLKLVHYIQSKSDCKRKGDTLKGIANTLLLAA